MGHVLFVDNESKSADHVCIHISKINVAWITKFCDVAPIMLVLYFHRLIGIPVYPVVTLVGEEGNTQTVFLSGPSVFFGGASWFVYKFHSRRRYIPVLLKNLSPARK
jgi:hypothetical protein